jgi:DNA-binding NarL/FixJ family response regulator
MGCSGGSRRSIGIHGPWRLNWKKEKAIRNQSFVRSVVVDDYRPWQQYVPEKLRECPNCRALGFALDGLEAVRKATELRPDLIFLDLGVPGLSGMEAARQILALIPESKIILLAQDPSADVIQETRRLGVSGCVPKINAENDLLAAVEAAISGKQFFS